MDGNLSLADVAALNKDGDSNGLLWLLMIFVLLGWGGGSSNPTSAATSTPTA